MQPVYAYISFLVLVLILICPAADAQRREPTSSNRRAINSYEEGLRLYERYDYKNAESFLKEAIRRDAKFIEPHIILMQVYQETGQAKLAIEMGETVMELNPDFFPAIQINLGNLLFKVGEYQRALPYYKKATEINNLSDNARHLMVLRLASSKFAIDAMANPVPFEPINLGANVNSPLDEYWPSLSADENTLVITVNVPRDTSISEVIYNRQEDFYITTRGTDGEWQPRRDIGPPINTPMYNEGAQSLTADGQRMYYTVCRGLCDLYVSDRQPNGTWSRPKKLPPPLNSHNSSEKQPSISPDGQTLYFVSNRSEGYGNFDIYRSTRTGESTWSMPENLGETINTRYNEQSPFIHFDNITLYFASDGHVGMGGLDMFKTQMIDDTTWSEPVNIGYPINTHADEDGLIVNAKGTMAYYSSNVDPEMGRDIFKFELHSEAQPNPASYIRGIISDAKTGRPVEANIQLVDLSTGDRLMNAQAQPDGLYLVSIPTNRRYALFASAQGYLFHSSHFNLEGIHSAERPYRKDIQLEPIEVGSVLVMRNIFFETDSYELLPESRVELNRLIGMLEQNKEMSIEIGGHTDNIGSAEYNKELSENRAKAVAEYITKRVAPERVTWKGYGLTKPIGDNETEEGRAQNRRTEIRIEEI